MPKEAKTGVVVVVVVSILGIVFQFIGGTYFFATKIATINASKAERSELHKLEEECNEYKETHARELATYQQNQALWIGEVNAKLDRIQRDLDDTSDDVESIREKLNGGK